MAVDSYASIEVGNTHSRACLGRGVLMSTGLPSGVFVFQEATLGAI